MNKAVEALWNSACATLRPTAAVMSAVMVAALALSAPNRANSADAPVLKRVPISAGGGMAAANRSYSYYVSSKANRAGYNLVVYALHDNDQSAEQFARQSGWIKVAEDNGFVVVFPEAVNKTWSPFTGEEDAYLKAVYDNASTHLTTEPRPDDPVRRIRPEAEGGEGGERRDRAGPGEQPRGERPQGRRIGTWQPWQYMTGAGAGARVVQEFAINNPGLVTAVATLDGIVYNASYARGDEVAQGYFQNQRGGKTVIPLWRPLKKNVPVPAWLFTTGAPSPAGIKLEGYWKHSNGIASAADQKSIDGFQTAVYANAHNAVEQVRVTSVPASAKYDESMVAAMWRFFSHIARWTSAPNGELGPMMTEPEVKQLFETRQAHVGDLTYQYYVKTPSSYTKGKALPLVISLHGGGYPAWMYLNQIRMHELGEKEGFITVYPSGQGNGWDISNPDGNDTKLIAQVIEEMAADYGIDRTRVYLQGFSIGSGLTFVAGITHPQFFAAVSPNSGIGDFDARVTSWVANLKSKQDIRLPMMIVYGAVDVASSTDGLIPAQGVLRNAIDNMKTYDGIATPDTTKVFDSPHAPAYEILVPGAPLHPSWIDGHYRQGRFQRYDYLSSEGQPIFSWVWIVDMPHGTAPGQAQMIWDFFKTWRRNPDGSLTYAAR